MSSRLSRNIGYLLIAMFLGPMAALAFAQARQKEAAPTNAPSMEFVVRELSIEVYTTNGARSCDPPVVSEKSIVVACGNSSGRSVVDIDRANRTVTRYNIIPQDRPIPARGGP